MVVGGRALEEDEEGADQPAPLPGNFTFYNIKASEYTRLERSGPCVLAGATCVHLAGGAREIHREQSPSWGCLGLPGLQGGPQWGRGGL